MTPSMWEDIERRQAILRAGRESGEISEADYAAGMARLRLRDEQGTWWQIGDAGEWLFWDGAAWVTGSRPAADAGQGSEVPFATAPQRRVCPDCGAEVGVEKRFCTQCGHDVTALPAKKQAFGAGARTCPHCAAQVGADKAYCTQCGQKLMAEMPSESAPGPRAVASKMPPEVAPVPPPAAEPPPPIVEVTAAPARRRWLLWLFALVAVVVVGVAGFMGWQARQRRLALPAGPVATAVPPTPVLRVQSALGRQIAVKGDIRLGIAPDNLLPLRAPTPEQGEMTGFEVEWSEAMVARLWGDSFPVTWVLMPTIEGVRQVVSGEIDAFVGVPGHVAGVSATAPYLANDAALWERDVGAEDPASGWVIILAPGGDELAAELDAVRDELIGEGTWSAIYRRWFNRPPPPNALPGWAEIPGGE